MPFSGEIVLEDRYEINRDPVAYRMRVNYAEAEPLYPSFLTPRDLVGFVGKTKQAPVGQVDTLTDLLGVNRFWTQPDGASFRAVCSKNYLCYWRCWVRPDSCCWTNH